MHDALPHCVPRFALSSDCKARAACVCFRCAVPNWLPDDAVAALRRDASMCDAAGLPRSAGIGSTRSGETAVRQDASVRISRMLPLYPPPSSRAGEVDTRIAFGEGIRSLGSNLESSLHWLPALAPFRTELAYLFYPAGGLYKRHMTRALTHTHTPDHRPV